MADGFRYSADDQRRIRSAVRRAVEARPVGAVVAADALEVEDAAVKASRRVNATLVEMRWIRKLVAEAVASREAESAR